LDVEAGLFAEGSFSLAAKLGIGSLAVSGGRRAAARGSFCGEVLELARAQLGGARGSEPGMTALTAIATLRVELANDWLDYLTAFAAFFAALGTVAAVGWAIYAPSIRERRWRLSLSLENRHEGDEQIFKADEPTSTAIATAARESRLSFGPFVGPFS
jgi:hypothetical protein